MIIIHKWVYYVLFAIVIGVAATSGLMAWQLMMVTEQNRLSREDRIYLHRENERNRVILEELQGVVRDYRERERQRRREPGAAKE